MTGEVLNAGELGVARVLAGGGVCRRGSVVVCVWAWRGGGRPEELVLGVGRSWRAWRGCGGVSGGGENMLRSIQRCGEVLEACMDVQDPSSMPERLACEPVPSQERVSGNGGRTDWAMLS